jgi:hypothetical protein
VILDLRPAELRMVGIVHLLAHVKLDKQGFDDVVLAVSQAFHVECPHRLDGSLGAHSKKKFLD